VIVEWLIFVGASISEWFASLFPVWDPPEFLVTFDDQLNGIMANLSGVGVWADWVYILIVVGVVIVVWGFSLLIKLARAVAAHIPFFGGAG
jgi:hypothetical protein